MNNQNFLGTGWSFPPTFLRPVRGVAMTSGEEDIQRSLEVLLATALGERVMEPGYGSNMEDLVFESMDTGTQTLLFDRIETAILYHESRIEVEKIELDTSRLTEGVMLVIISYRVRSTNSRYNYVYPFYQTEGSEIRRE
ncbi:MAG: GPW/gp25 family protein [Bacteroidota bacterium]